MGVFQNNLMGAAAAAASAGGGGVYSHQIANSCRFIGASGNDGTNYMYHTRGTPTNGDKCTISAWVKRGKLGSKDQMFTGSGLYGGQYSWLGFNTANEYYDFQEGSNRLESNALFRDTNAWMHIVVANDSTQGTAANRNKIYINGVQYTDWGDYETYSTQNADFYMNTSGYRLFVGSGGASEGNSWLPYEGYIAEYVFIDGTQYAASDFGETVNGVWQPKDPSGLTFGNNGAYLKFESSSDLGNDSSGNNNDFTVAGVAAHDQMLDSPTFNSDTNGGNFPTYNPLTKGSYTDLSEGNLKADSNTGADASYPSGNIPFPSSGKWYYEQLIETKNSTYPTPFLVSFGDTGLDLTRGIFWSLRYTLAGAAQKSSGGAISQFGTITLNSTGGASFASGDIMSWYIDMDNKKAWVAKNGTIPNSGNPASGTNPQFAWTTNPKNGFTFGSQEYQSSSTILNTGSDGTFAGEKTAQGNTDDTGYGNFYYNPPTGFLAMCTGNLPLADAINPALTSDDFPQKLFNPLLYTGDGGSSTAITGLGFQPDWVWIKRRNAAENNNLYDSSRGVNKRIKSNSDGAETTEGLPAFGSDGFTVDASGSINNVSSQTYVAWNWRANGGSLTTNNEGTQTSYTQTDPSGAFSITKYAGTGSSMTVGHGLSIEPKLTIVKDRGASVNWIVYTKIVDGSLDYFFLDTDAASGASGLTGPNSSIWNFNAESGYSNTSGRNYIMYNFANVEGYCKVGTYIGNANDDGTFLPTGFKPAFFMCKPILTGNWRIQDTTRSPFNVADKTLFPNHNNAEESNDSQYIDILSNGIKMRANDSNFNQATTFVYLAFAKNPFKYATAR